MANVNKNGNLSGAVGNIVFVNDGDRSFVRTKPSRMKQSPATKKSAAVFGVVSVREKLFRLRLLSLLGMPALQYFAARHRARIRKTVTAAPPENTSANAVHFGDPQALVGFDFNPKTEWQRCTNFFPVVERHSTDELTVRLPQLKWKAQLLPPKNCTSAVLTILALRADLNKAHLPVKAVSKMVFDVSALVSVPAQEWTFPVTDEEGWMIVVACVKFNTTLQSANAAQHYAGTYLWTAMPQE